MSFLSKKDSIFLLFKKAILGEEQNFTEGSINKAIFLLAVPMILEMVMESLFAVIDVYFVSQLHDNDAIATVGLTESVLTLIYSLAMGLSMGATAMVARRVGEKDIASASKAAMQALYIGVCLSVIISVVGLIFSEEILKLLGASDGVIEKGIGYTHVMFGGNLTIVFLFLINGIFRGAGDASLAMRSLLLANGLNIILDPIFIFGLGPIPAFGVAGAAIATNTGRGIGVLYQVYHLLKAKGLIKIAPVSMPVQWGIIWRLLKLSAGGAGQFLIASASWIFLTGIISDFGSTALAGYTIAIRIIVFAILPAWGMANAAATLVGQNLGAGLPDRAEKSVWKAAFFNMIFLGSVSVIFLLLAKPIILLFTHDTKVLQYGTQCLKVVCLGYMFYAYGMVISQAFNGAGDTRTPTILNFVGFWLVQIPLAYYLAVKLEYGPTGVFSAISLAESLLAIICIIVFRLGHWKTVQV